nr:DHHA2 domain-containing protein [Pantoea cypripedii]
MIHVTGHINPDSDAICTAVVTAYWLNQQHRPAHAWRAGEANRETRFIFAEAGLPLPERLTLSLKGEDVWLVDFTEPAQGPDDLHQSNVIGIIDHHRLGGLMTQLPPEVWIKPVGSSATVLWLLMDEADRNSLASSHAILLLGAILSDTVNLKSPTTTEEDIRTVTQLCVRTGINRKTFGRHLLSAKTDLDGLSSQHLLEKDLKAFVIAGTDVRISQIEVMNPSQVSHLITALCEELKNTVAQSGAGLGVLMVTDITDNFSTLYFAGRALKNVGPCSLPGMLSRKKQLLPWLHHHLEQSRGEA